MKNYSVLKMKEILPHVTTWMNLEDLVLSGISQTQDEYFVSPLIWEAEEHGGCQGMEEGEWVVTVRWI